MDSKIAKNGTPFHFKISLFTLLIGSLLAAAFTSAQAAGTLAEATEAIQNGNYIRARMLYMELADRNNPVALFNLGVMEKQGLGTAANPFEARTLFEKASQYKLVDAYNSIQLAIKPAGDRRITIVQTAQEWILSQNGNYYTLQLASSTNRKLIEKYYNENQLHGKAGYYANRRQGEDWYALVYGAFPTAGEANAAIATLPQDLRKWSPWVRKLKDIQRLIKN